MSPKKTAARATREKVAQMRAAERRRQRRNNLIWAAVVLVVVGILAGGAAFVIIQQNAERREDAAGVRSFTGLSQNHVTGTVNYPQTPPVGGDHHAVWLNCGIYSQPVKNENAVHSLEHGAVWITYRPGLAADQIGELRELVSGKPYTLLSPYEGLGSPIVASAWGKQLTVTDAADSRLTRFIRDYAQGSQTPEPGASCTNGVGQPEST